MTADVCQSTWAYPHQIVIYIDKSLAWNNLVLEVSKAPSGSVISGVCWGLVDYSDLHLEGSEGEGCCFCDSHSLASTDSRNVGTLNWLQKRITVDEVWHFRWLKFNIRQSIIMYSLDFDTSMEEVYPVKLESLLWTER